MNVANHFFWGKKKGNFVTAVLVPLSFKALENVYATLTKLICKTSRLLKILKYAGLKYKNFSSFLSLKHMYDGLKLKLLEILLENSRVILLWTRNQAVQRRPPEAYKDMHKSSTKFLPKCLLSPSPQNLK